MKGIGRLKIKKLAEENRNPSVMSGVLKGTLGAICFSLIGILIFAFSLKFLPIPEAAIRPVNQIIKCLSIFLGSFIALKKIREQGLITGLLIGIFYTALAFVIFSTLDGKFEFGKTLVNDILFGGITGGICGIIAVNFGKKK